MEEGGDDGGESSSSIAAENKDIESQSDLPSRKWTALWLHASIMGGREFLYAVEVVLVTPIILQLGMPERFYSFMWCFSPIIGVLIGPVLGSSSDQCKSRFGRRRPFIVALVFGAIIGLSLLIFSKDIAFAFGGDNLDSRRLWGVVVGIVGAQLMDFCLDQTETPLRAYTLDVCSSKDQQRAFALQTVFIGIGGALGFIVDGIDWQKTLLSSLIDSQIKVVYVFAVAAYLSTTICNLFSIKEIPLRHRKPSIICNAAITKRVVATQLPMLRRTRSLQVTSCSDGCTQTTFDDADMFQPRPTKHLSLQIHPKISFQTDDEFIFEKDPISDHVESVQLLSSQLDEPQFVTTSCPGGLESKKQLQVASDSVNTNEKNPNEDGPVKTTRHCSRSRVLLDFIRHKEFSIRTLKNKNRIMHKSSCKIPVVPDAEEGSGRLLGNGIVRNERKSVSSHDSSLPECCRTGQTKCEVKVLEESERENASSLKQLWLSIATMPSQLKWLCLTQLLGFIGFETVMLWYTDLMGREVYGGDPQAASNSSELLHYNAGVKVGCWGLAIYSVAMILFSVFMERCKILKRFSIRKLYSFSFVLMAGTMLLMYVFTDRYVILLLSWTIGVSMAVLLTIPYVLVGKYHRNVQYVMKSPGKTKRGFGLDCGILACQMYAGNIVSASTSSPVIHFAGSVKAMLLLSGACNILAFIFAFLFVTYPGEGRSQCQRKEKVERSTETT